MPDRSGEPRPGRDEPAPDPLEAKRAQQAAAREAIAAQTQLEATQRSAMIALRAAAVAECQLCDEDGYRNAAVCDHHDHTAANQAGIAAIRAILTSQRPSTRRTPENSSTGHTDPKATHP